MISKHYAPESQKVWLGFCALLILAAGWLMGYYTGMRHANLAMSRHYSPPKRNPFDFGNQTYAINSQKLSFVNGTFKNNQQHTATIMSINENGSHTRAATILVDEPGGSGSFSYLVGAMITNDKVVYSQPVLLGDRITIVSINVDEKSSTDNGMITVTYLDHAPNTPMVTAPTQKQTKKYAFEDNGTLVEVLH